MVVAPVSTWTGCYIGGNIGWARVSTEVTFNGVGEFDRSADGFAGGGQIGCDYQFASNWVIGIQGLVDWTRHRSQSRERAVPGQYHSRQSGVVWDAHGSARLRRSRRRSCSTASSAGALIAPASRSRYAAGVELASASRTQSGFDLGVGGEWMFAPNWSLWIEWDHIFAQDKTFFFPNLGGGTTAEVRRDLDKVLVGFNWRFGGVGAAPVAARY